MEGFIYQSTEKLLEDAELHSRKVTEEAYRQTVYLYYISRYLHVLCEGRGQKIPIQVWNEYRNAFDHFARHLAVASSDMRVEDSHLHLNKMEGHIQRSVLDICKLICLYGDDFYKERILPDTSVLALVSDGRFLKEINEIFTAAERQFVKAKSTDIGLGEEVGANKETIKDYCDAVFLYQKIEDLYSDNYGNVIQAGNNYRNLRTQGKSLSRRDQFLIAIIGAAVFFVIGKFW